jgi:hypothetical protein
MKTCPQCNFNCQDTDIVCTNCGYLFSADGSTPRAPETNIPPEQAPSSQQAPSYQQPVPPAYQPPEQSYYANQPNNFQGVPAPKSGSNGLAIAGFVLGLIGLLTSWCWGFGILPAIPGLILSILAVRQVKKTGQAGNGLAITGIILSAIAIPVGIGFFAYELNFILNNPAFQESLQKAQESASALQ